MIPSDVARVTVRRTIAMTIKDEKRKAAAKCVCCGEISAVEIEPDGSVIPIGQATICRCSNPEVKILQDGGDDEPTGCS